MCDRPPTSRFALVALVACSGSSPHTSPSGGDRAVERREVAVWCEKVVACCTKADRALRQQPDFDTAPQCTQIVDGLYTWIVAPIYRHSFSRGRIRFDGQAAETRLAALEHASCVELDTFSGPSPYIAGTVPLGGACMDDHECGSRNCMGAEFLRDDMDRSKDGTCRPIPANGEPCAHACQHGSYCDDVCKPAKPNGETCINPDECASEACANYTCVARPPCGGAA